MTLACVSIRVRVCPLVIWSLACTLQPVPLMPHVLTSPSPACSPLDTRSCLHFFCAPCINLLRAMLTLCAMSSPMQPRHEVELGQRERERDPQRPSTADQQPLLQPTYHSVQYAQNAQHGGQPHGQPPHGMHGAQEVLQTTAVSLGPLGGVAGHVSSFGPAPATGQLPVNFRPSHGSHGGSDAGGAGG